MKLEQYDELFQAQVQVLDEVGVTIEDESLVRSIGMENVGQIQMAWTDAMLDISVWFYALVMGPMCNTRILTTFV